MITARYILNKTRSDCTDEKYEGIKIKYMPNIYTLVSLHNAE